MKVFLWWPNGDLTKEMEEYRIVKHLFGATSWQRFDAKVEATVKCNIYVDIMMKLASASEKVVSLASQLRRLLEKGVF